MPPLQIGVMLEKVQFSDITGIDVFANIGTECIKLVTDEYRIPDMMPLATDIKFHYISSQTRAHIDDTVSGSPAHGNLWELPP